MKMWDRSSYKRTFNSLMWKSDLKGSYIPTISKCYLRHTMRWNSWNVYLPSATKNWTVRLSAPLQLLRSRCLRWGPWCRCWHLPWTRFPPVSSSSSSPPSPPQSADVPGRYSWKKLHGVKNFIYLFGKFTHLLFLLSYVIFLMYFIHYNLQRYLLTVCSRYTR